MEHYIGVTDVPLLPKALVEVASGFAEVAAEFSGEVGGPPTLAEFLEIIGWAIPINSDAVADGFPERLPLRASLRGGRRYGSGETSRVGELNDNVFDSATDCLALLFRRLGAVTEAPITPGEFADAIRDVLNTGRVILADMNGSDIRKIIADLPRKSAVKAAIGDLLAIPVVPRGYRIAVVLVRNRFGTALGLFAGTSRNGRLTARLRNAPLHHPVYTEDSLVRNGTWRIVGHNPGLLALFPADPEIYHKPGAWPGIDTGEYGAAETADGPLRLIGAAEARDVGLVDGSYRQVLPAAFLQEFLRAGNS